MSKIVSGSSGATQILTPYKHLRLLCSLQGDAPKLLLMNVDVKHDQIGDFPTSQIGEETGQSRTIQKPSTLPHTSLIFHPKLT